MKKLALLMVLLLALTGCAPGGDGVQTGEESPGTGEEISFTDDLGRELTVAPPRRVAVLTGSFADIWCLAGGRETVVAAAGDSWTAFDLGLPDTAVDLGGIKTPDLERLIASRPDLVLASCNTSAQVELLPILEDAGLKAAYFHVTHFDDYLNMLDICTKLTGQEEAYGQYGLGLAEQVEQAKNRADGSRPTVLYIRATGSGCKVKNSRNTVLGEMLADLDCVNIADGEDTLLEELSMEAILRADPDYIFAVLQGADPTDARLALERTLLNDPAWQALTAVEEGRFHVLEHELYNLKPNARWGEAYEKLSKILYPDP